jgi:hypothetical protein
VNIMWEYLLYLKTQSSFKSGGSFKIYEDQVKSDANAMQVLDDTGKVLMNIVGGDVFFNWAHWEISGSFKKKDRGEANEELESSWIRLYTSKTHKTRIRLKAALNGQPQLTIIQVAKS